MSTRPLALPPFPSQLLGAARGELFGVGGAGGSTTRRDVLPRIPSAAKLSLSAPSTQSVLTALRSAIPTPSSSSSDRKKENAS
jgi:hypothetical protein